MKKITSFLFLLLVFCGYSQVQVGSGTNTSQYLPINPGSAYSYSQTIYRASEINASGKITSIQWYYKGSGSMPNSQDLVIYMGTTSKSSFATSYDWIPGLTQVYAGGITTGATQGWKTIQLTTAFDYDGVNNLVVAVDENRNGYDSGTDKFWNTEVEDNRSIGYFSMSVNPNPSAPPTSGGGTGSFLASYVPDIIFGGISSNCVPAYNITVSNISDVSATLTWQPSQTAPTGGSDFYFSTDKIRPTSTTTPKGSIVSGNSANLSQLQPNTKYYAWVRNNCGSAYSAWSELVSFTTWCSAIAGFSENFDTGPNLPTCWSKIVKGASVAANANVFVQSQAAYAFSGSNSVELDNGSSTGTYDVILVSPNLSNLNSGTYRLKFYAAGDVDMSVDVGTLNSNLSSGNFNLLKTVAITTDMKEYTVNINYGGHDTYIGLRINASGSYHSLYLDDIQWVYAPACPDISAVTVPAVTESGATIDWIKAGTEDSWDVAIGNPTDTDPSTLSHTNTDSVPYDAAELSASTDYKVWVRSVCSAGAGVWVGPVAFRTDCTPVATFTENFDTAVKPVLPSCWSKIVKGDGIASGADVKITDTDYYTKSNAVALSNSTSTGGFHIIAVSPNLSTLATGGYRLRFLAKGVGFLDIGTLSSNTTLATFTNADTKAITEAYAQYIVEFPQATTDTHVGIRLSSPAQNNTIYIDNVIWEKIPTCPDVSAIALQSVTEKSATFTWQSPDNVSTWDIAVGLLSETDPNTLSYESTDIKGIFTKTKLTENTKYQVWIRSACGDNKGSWMGPVAFSTNCVSVESFGEDFNDTPVSELPSCWTKILKGSSLSVAADVAVADVDIDGTEPNWVQLTNKNSTGKTYDVILASPPVSTLSLGTYRLRFRAKRIATNVNLQIGTMDDNSIVGNFSLLTTIELGTDYKEYKVYFSAFNGTTDKFIAFRLNSLDGYKTIKLDDIYWELAPVCPDAANIKVVSVTGSSATLTWDVLGDNAVNAKKWDIVVGPLDSDPNALTPKSSSVNSFEFPGLEPSKTYNVWVRANCEGVSRGTGAWIGPVRFNTDCLPVDSFSEGFNDTPFPYMAPCWSSIIRNAASTSLVYNSLQAPKSAHSKPGNVTIFSDNSAVGADVIMVSPAISTLNVAANYQLSFYASGSNTLEVGTLNTNSDTAVFTKVTELNVQGVGGGDNNTLHIVDMSTAKATDKYIGFRIVTGYMGGSQQYITMDDIEWTPKLGNGDLAPSTFHYYPNPVKDFINISYSTTIDSVGVYNLLGQQVIFNEVGENQARIDMSSLERGAYLVKIYSGSVAKTVKVIKE